MFNVNYITLLRWLKSERELRKEEGKEGRAEEGRKGGRWRRGKGVREGGREGRSEEGRKKGGRRKEGREEGR